jgi:hypothetical protein
MLGSASCSSVGGAECVANRIAISGKLSSGRTAEREPRIEDAATFNRVAATVGTAPRYRATGKEPGGLVM